MNKSKKDNRIILIIVLAVVTVVVSTIAVTGKATSLLLMFTKHGTVEDGVLSGVSEHITDVPDGEVRFLINKSITFKNSFSRGDVMLENPESGEYVLKFLFYSPEGKLIYTSPLISPGQCLAEDKLSATLNAGEYQCAYSAQAYDGDNFMGEVTGIVKIRIGS